MLVPRRVKTFAKCTLSSIDLQWFSASVAACAATSHKLPVSPCPWGPFIKLVVPINWVLWMVRWLNFSTPKKNWRPKFLPPQKSITAKITDFYGWNIFLLPKKKIADGRMTVGAFVRYANPWKFLLVVGETWVFTSVTSWDVGMVALSR